jgi:hypothetical protein
MTPATVNLVDTSHLDETAPPPGTAIVRPWRHVQAVRERHAQQFTNPAEVAASRSVGAWGWALGETKIAPVTDRPTKVPPARSDIEAEIAVADERRLRGDQEGRADTAAIILRWLIGDDDHVPVRGQNLGELVGGFGDVVRSPEQIANVMARAADGQRRAEAQARNVELESVGRQFAQRETDYFGGVVATLAWALGKQPETPMTRTNSQGLTSRQLKLERVHAEDLIGQAKSPRAPDGRLSAGYGEGVKYTITWLLGDQITPPVDMSGSGPYDQCSEPPAMQKSGSATPDCRQ